MQAFVIILILQYGGDNKIIYIFVANVTQY